MKLRRIAIDASKHVLTLHGVDEGERTVLRRELRRGQVAGFFGKQEPTEVVLEACGSAHHWQRWRSVDPTDETPRRIQRRTRRRQTCLGIVRGTHLGPRPWPHESGAQPDSRGTRVRSQSLRP